MAPAPHADPPATPEPAGAPPEAESRESNPEVNLIVRSYSRKTHVDTWKVAAAAREGLGDVLNRLGTTEDETTLLALLAAYSAFADLQGVDSSPPELVRLARTGTPSVRARAMRILGTIGDETAVSLLAEALSTEPLSELDREIRIDAISASGGTHSEALSNLLEEIARRNEPGLTRMAVAAMGNIGFGNRLSYLDELLETAKGDLLYVARRARAKVEIANAADRDERLIRLVNDRPMSGQFSWYDWALEKVIYLRLTHLTGRLREIYDRDKEQMVRTLPTAHSFDLLKAIGTLGGSLSAEEIQDLERAGRIR